MNWKQTPCSQQRRQIKANNNLLQWLLTTRFHFQYSCRKVTWQPIKKRTASHLLTYTRCLHKQWFVFILLRQKQTTAYKYIWHTFVCNRNGVVWVVRMTSNHPSVGKISYIFGFRNWWLWTTISGFPTSRWHNNMWARIQKEDFMERPARGSK